MVVPLSQQQQMAEDSKSIAYQKGNRSTSKSTTNNDGAHSETVYNRDAGAQFVLESKGEWRHAGYHLTTAIVTPTILALPYAFRGLGWTPGLLCLTVMGLVTFYEYHLMSLVLDYCENAGRRHIRFRELAADVLGSGWMFYFVIVIQMAINGGAGIGTILLAGECIEYIVTWAAYRHMTLMSSNVNLISISVGFWKIIYTSLSPHGSLKLYHFIAMATAVMIVLSQIPTFHSLRHINLGSLILSLAYSALVVGACINAGNSKNAPPRDYSLEPSKKDRVFNAFTSISIIAAIFGTGILPEIRATLAPPATGKLLKGLILCYSVVAVTFYTVAVSGYYVFGNQSNAIILNSLMPDEGPAFAPTWALTLAVVFILLQLFAIGLVYSQVVFEIMEKKSADVKQGMFSKRNLIPRLFLRTTYMILSGLFAAMLPFFGDINGVVGAIGFIPLDFILPIILYNMTHQPRKMSFRYWVNGSIVVVFTSAGLLGAISSFRKLVLDADKFKLFSSQVAD